MACRTEIAPEDLEACLRAGGCRRWCGCGCGLVRVYPFLQLTRWWSGSGCRQMLCASTNHFYWIEFYCFQMPNGQRTSKTKMEKPSILSNSKILTRGQSSTARKSYCNCQWLRNAPENKLSFEDKTEGQEKQKLLNGSECWSCFSSMSDKSCETALRTQSKSGSIEQLTSDRCAARRIDWSFKKQSDKSNVMGLTIKELGILYYSCLPKKCHVNAESVVFDTLSTSWTFHLHVDHRGILKILYEHHEFLLPGRRNTERRAFVIERWEVA